MFFNIPIEQVSFSSQQVYNKEFSLSGFKVNERALKSLQIKNKIAWHAHKKLLTSKYATNSIIFQEVNNETNFGDYMQVLIKSRQLEAGKRDLE